MVAGGDILDAQPVSSGQQSRKAQVRRGVGSFLRQLAGQLGSVQRDALDAKVLGSIFRSLNGGVLFGKADHSTHDCKALLL